MESNYYTINEAVDRKEILLRYKSLLQISKSFASRQELKQLRKALDLALEYYREKRFEDGKPFIFYPLEIARIMAEEIGMGIPSIISSLLFSPVYDKHITSTEIKEQFGDEILVIIDGINKISEISPAESLHAENLRKYLLTLAKDVRVLLVQIVIHLYKLRNISSFVSEDSSQIALEATTLYSPLAHRLGLYNIKGELDDLAMKFTQLAVYRQIEKQLQETMEERGRFVKEFIEPIEKSLQDNGFKFSVKWRTKRVHSIYRKMKKQQVDFDEVYDKFAIRIILDSKPKKEKADCWRVYSIITEIYPPNPKRLRDWISIPKSSGYESLHTTVMSPLGRWVEIQIRTTRMDDIAEKGFAAHWRYKGQSGEKELDKLLTGFREIIEQPGNNALDVLDNFKINLYSDEVFVFTPNGDLKKLPAGSTVLDFAFEIHTEVGSHCVGARVNHKQVPLRQELKNGDQIEILTSKNQKPTKDWLKYVQTSKAKAKIKKVIDEERYKIAEEGKEILQRKLKNWKINLDDNTIGKVMKSLKLKTATDLYFRIATDKIDPLQIKSLLQTVEENQVDEALDLAELANNNQQISPDQIVFNDPGLKGIAFRMAKCCEAMPGDPIIGFITLAGDISIHRKNCPNAIRMSERFGYREILVGWGSENKAFQISLKLNGTDRHGLIADLSELMRNELKINLRSLNIDAKEGEFEAIMKLHVSNPDHLDVLIQRIQKLEGVKKVQKV